uniref:Nudix hydrolase domain-containing protein n=1 Tax=Homalodisca liturata TaxID=320908 RepID=A0A1B6JVS0_9HEMI
MITCFTVDKYFIVIFTMMSVSTVASVGNFHDYDSPRKSIHFRCRAKVYPFLVERLEVSDERVRWDYPWPNYRPPLFTASSTLGQPWADPDLSESFKPQWNCQDGLINRKSYVGLYTVQEGYPLNVIGRTGLRGRGVLGRWGPNHAADSCVTRWKTDENKALVVNPQSRKPILQLITIQKRSGEWGIPGGMVHPGESVVTAGKREFFEEVLAYEPNRLGVLHEFFSDGVEIYKGYVDDPRNTDNAWVETIAIHYHDSEQLFDSITLMAGDDACDVAWTDVDRHMELYSGHPKFLREMTSRLNAHF